MKYLVLIKFPQTRGKDIYEEVGKIKAKNAEKAINKLLSKKIDSQKELPPIIKEYNSKPIEGSFVAIPIEKITEIGIE